MESLDKLTEGMEEHKIEEAKLPFPPPVVEEVIHRSVLNIINAQGVEGDLVILQFLTPGKTYSVKLTAEFAQQLGEALRGSSVVVASPLDLPPGVKL